MYGTNFQYSSSWFMDNVYQPYIPNRAIIYDNQCSCGLQSNCTTQAYIYLENSTKIFLKGFQMGCIPSESLHVSTLECFYDQTCLDHIQQINFTINPLLITETSQFQMNTTVLQLIHNLFVEQWNISMNYSSYYHQCLPSLCSYTYIQQFNILYLITFLLGLQGGLSIVLGWISPKIIRIFIKIHGNRNRRSNRIHPLPSTSVATISNDNITITSEYIFH